MTGLLTGYAYCSTDAQDLAAQRETLRGCSVPEDRICLDRGLTGTSRNRPGLAMTTLRSLRLPRKLRCSATRTSALAEATLTLHLTASV